MNAGNLTAAHISQHAVIRMGKDRVAGVIEHVHLPRRNQRHCPHQATPRDRLADLLPEPRGPDRTQGGEVSIKPGLHYGIPNDDYHAEADHLSSTQIKKALPEHYRDGDLNTAALEFGTLVHSVVLEPDTLDQYTVLDAAKIGVKADGTPAQNPTMTAAWKRAVAEAAEAGLIVVSQADWDKAHLMADAIKAHPEAADLLHDAEGVSEASAFATDDNGVKVKARFDRLIDGAIIDLKTTNAKPGASSLRKVVANFLYDLSAYHYLEVARLLDLGAETFWLVFVSKDDKPLVTVARLSDAFLERGRDLRSLALDRLAGDTEAYEGATGRLTLHPPGWANTTTTSGGVISPDFTWSIHDEPA